MSASDGGAAPVGMSSSRRGNVTVSFPDGSTSPNSVRAIASPPPLPGYQASSTARTRPAHGIVTGPPVSNTTIVFGFAAASPSA